MLFIYIGFKFFYNYYCFHFSKISVYSNVYVPNYMIFNPPSPTQLILYIKWDFVVYIMIDEHANPIINYF